jgi:PST family polysaccharide transporter
LIKEIWKNKKDSKVISNYIYLLLIQGTNFILPLITFPYLVRTLGLEKYGVVMIASSLVVFLNIMVDFGFNISATREVSIIRNDKEKLSELFWNVITVKILLLLFSFLFLLSLVSFIDKFKSEYLVYLFSFGIVLGQNIFPAWLFQGIERMKVITIINVSAKVIFTISIFIFIKSKSEYLYVPILNSMGFIIAGIVGFIMSLKYVNFKKPSIVIMKGFINENKNLIASNFATSIYTSGNTFILGMIGGDIIAGVYSSMEKLVMATKTIYTPLYQAIFPWLATKPKKEIITFINKLKKPILISGIIISSIIFIFAELILSLIYNDPIINSHAYIFKILGFIALIASLNMIYVSLCFPSLKLYKFRMIPMVLGGIINLILAILGASYYSILGVAVAAVFSEFMILIIAHYYFKNKIII